MKFVILISIVIIQQCIAASNLELYTGGNLSTINNSECKIKSGELFGIARRFGSLEKNISIGCEYVLKSAYLQNKTMIFPIGDQGYHFDLFLSVAYLELPLLVNLNTKIFNRIPFGIVAGPSLAIAIYDNSKWYNSRHFNIEYDQQTNFEYDYSESDSAPFPLLNNSTICINLGVKIFFNHNFIILKFNHSMNELGTIGGLIMNNEKLSTMELIFGIDIAK